MRFHRKGIRDWLGIGIASQAGRVGQAVVWLAIVWAQVSQVLPSDEEAVLLFVSRCLSMRAVLRRTQELTSQGGRNIPSGIGQCVLVWVL